MRIFGKSGICLPHPYKNAPLFASILGINPDAPFIKRPLFLLRNPLGAAAGPQAQDFFYRSECLKQSGVSMLPVALMEHVFAHSGMQGYAPASWLAMDVADQVE